MSVEHIFIIILNFAVSGHSQNKGCHAVEAILALEKSMLIYNENIHALENQLLGNTTDGVFTTANIPSQLNEARRQ